jgi:hypothetical protein
MDNSAAVTLAASTIPPVASPLDFTRGWFGVRNRFTWNLAVTSAVSKSWGSSTVSTNRSRNMRETARDQDRSKFRPHFRD